MNTHEILKEFAKRFVKKISGIDFDMKPKRSHVTSVLEYVTELKKPSTQSTLEVLLPTNLKTNAWFYQTIKLKKQLGR